jgi:protein TonB
LLKIASALAALLAATSALAQPAASSPASAASGSGHPVSCRPGYPPAAMAAKAEGVTRLRLDIDAQGHATIGAILQSAGPSPEHKLLDEAAATALVQCPFKPAVDGAGHPVAASVNIEYVWRMH